jgi:hypothetical protein
VAENAGMSPLGNPRGTAAKEGNQNESGGECGHEPAWKRNLDELTSGFRPKSGGECGHEPAWKQRQEQSTGHEIGRNKRVAVFQKRLGLWPSAMDCPA